MRSMHIDYIFITTISFIIVFLATPSIRYVALKFYVIDKIGSRKIHKKLVTKLGGLAIYFGFLGGISALTVLDLNFFKVNFYPFVSLLIGSTLMLILGIYDDFQEGKALVKLAIQIVISLLVVSSGYVIVNISVPGLSSFELGVFGVPVTLLWLVGITNAINFTDGLDGLAAGVAGIALLFIAGFGLLLHDGFIACVSLTLSAACLGFLKYNFYPAKIFMGDTGSLFLGFTVACLGVYRPPLHPGNPYFVPMAVIFFLPILDTVLAVVRRSLKGRSIFSGDFSHIHHYFMRNKTDQSQTVSKFYLMTFMLGVISFAIFVSTINVPVK